MYKQNSLFTLQSTSGYMYVLYSEILELHLPDLLLNPEYILIGWYTLDYV